MSRDAMLAMPAEDRQTADHMVAGVHMTDEVTHRFDDPGGLVAEAGR
jgi:hypothetical protein